MSFCRRYRSAFICCLVLMTACLIINPRVENGLEDDWAFAQVAFLFAKTGHILYNGWEGPILGWQVVFASVFIKMLGPTFFAVRLSTFTTALVTTFLLQRSMVRSGINDWNAAVGTLVIMSSQFFLNASFTFMTDMSGLAGIVLCFYLCLRSLQAATLACSIAWLSLAALSSSIGGTSRQVAWLGLLVMVPCTMWLLRRYGMRLWPAMLSFAVGVGFMGLSMKWYERQPYSLSQDPFRQFLNSQGIVRCLAASAISISLILYTVVALLAAFGFALIRQRRKHRLAIAVAVIASVAVDFLIYVVRHRSMRFTITPFAISSLGFAGVFAACLMTLLEALGVAGVWVLLGKYRESFMPGSLPWMNVPYTEKTLPLITLLVVVVPFALAYVALLVPRTISGAFHTRYALELIVFAALLLLRFYEEVGLGNLPASVVLITLAYMGFNCAQIHDVYVASRARLVVVQEMQRAGIADENIEGGLGFDGMVEIKRAGYVNYYLLNNPIGAYKPGPLLPHFRPLYTTTSDPAKAFPDVRLAPVTYHLWLRPHVVTVYAARL